MQSILRLRCPLVAAFAAVLVPCAFAQEVAPGTATESEAAKKFQAYAKEVAGSYELQAGEKNARKLKFISEPILRWTNPLGGHRAHGEIFLWTDAGLPAAILSLNEFTAANGSVRSEHEWCCLTSTPLIARGPHDWSPEESAISWSPLGDAMMPANSATRRLRQMRDLAGRFDGEKTTRSGEKRALRVLPQPLYRFQSEDADVLDGAVFALVEATDPEALLVIMARRMEAGQKWLYALARMNSLRVAACCDRKQVWEAPALVPSEVYDRKDKSYSAFLGQ